MHRSCLRRLAGCRSLRSEQGSALVELACVFAFLATPLLIGTVDMGFIVYDSIEVTNAAHAGALYGMQSSTYATNTSGITTAAQTEATDFGTALTVTPTTYYACSLAIGGTQYTGTNAQANATSACTGGTNHALEFVHVSTSVTVTPLVHLAKLVNSLTITRTSVMEVEQ
jgi:Flp pilus assembly protein TadG